MASMKGYWFLFFFTGVLAIGSFLFGYNTGVIGGAILLINEQSFPLSDTYKNLIASMAIVGGIVGALGGGLIATYFGRRPIIIISSIFYMAGAVLSAITSNATLLIIGRAIVGVGFGIASFAVPLYLAEMSPAKFRGMFVMYSVLMITSGQFVAYLANVIFENVNDWRWTFAIAAFPAAVQFGLMFLMPESARFYIQKKKNVDKAIASLKRVRPGSNELQDPANPKVDVVQEEISGIQAAIEAESSGGVRDLFTKYRPALIVGITLQLYQQFSGFNAVMYFAPILFNSGNVTIRQSIMYGMFITLCNVVFTSLSLFLVEKLGRRSLLFISLTGASLGMLLASISFLANVAPIVAFIGFIVFASFYAIGLGGVPWTVNSEIYPSSVRSMGNSFAATANWIFNLVVSLTFFPLKEAIGAGYLILIYAIFCFSGLFFVFFFVPETKGQKLEDVQSVFESSNCLWGWNDFKRRRRARRLNKEHDPLKGTDDGIVYTSILKKDDDVTMKKDKN